MSNNQHTSPFDLFRRNLKPMMVFLTGLALFAFVVLPVLDSYMRRNMGTGGDQVVARFEGTDLTRTRVDYFTRNHQSMVRFMMELAQETISRGGVPRTAGFQFDTQTNQVRSIGLNQAPSPEGTIRSFLFAAEANKAGFDLDDNTLQVWLERYTDGMISNSDIDGMLMASTQNQMGRPHLYEQLRIHLLASVFLNRGYAGLFMGDGPMSGPLMTPEESWSNFLKLNRKAVVDSYGVLVNDYLDKTNPSPSETVVAETYEEGKDRDYSDQSAEPAFHRRYSASFAYLVGNYQTFLDQEVAKLSDEDLRAEYEKRLKGGDFQLPEQEDEAAEEEMSPSEDEAVDDSEKADESSEKATDSTSDEDEKEPADEASEAADDATVEEGEAESTETDTASDEDSADSDSGDSDSGDSDTADNEADEDQASVAGPQAVRLVGLQDDDDTTADAEDNQEPAESEEKESSDEKAADDESKDDDESAEESAAAEIPADDDEPAEDKSNEPKVESFEDVRESIADDLAGPAARERMDAAITEATNAMRLYFRDRSIYESNVSIGQAGTPPAKPDLKALGEKLGLTYESIGPYSELTIADEPIANSFEVGTQFGRRGPSFSVMMYGFDNGQTSLPRQELYSPVRTADDPAGKIYVTWKTSETEAYTPTLDEVRAEVVMAVRMEEARGLARQAAEELAKQAAEAEDKSLADLVPEEKKEYFLEGLGPFSWMDSFGFQGATIGNVPELDSVGPEFMEAVFNTAQGEYAVATNQPGRVIYVVKPTKFEPSLDELRRQFKEPTNRMLAMMVGSDAGEIINAFYETVDEQSGFTSYLEEQE